MNVKNLIGRMVLVNSPEKRDDGTFAEVLCTVVGFAGENVLVLPAEDIDFVGHNYKWEFRSKKIMPVDWSHITLLYIKDLSDNREV